jgi:hypothetical protein
MSISIRSNLRPDQKAAIKTLQGRRIQEDEAVSVRTFEPVTVSHQRRLKIANELRILLKWAPPARHFGGGSRRHRH